VISEYCDLYRIKQISKWTDVTRHDKKGIRGVWVNPPMSRINHDVSKYYLN